MSKFLLISTLAWLLVACSGIEVVTHTSSFYDMETECLGKNMDGLQTLRVWATGNDKNDALTQAQKKAVYEVVFNGISAGAGECNAYPVVDEPNARKEYEDYFDRFFSDSGNYKKYVNIANKDKDAMSAYKSGGRIQFSIIVIVDRAGLRKQFKNDGIIK